MTVIAVYNMKGGVGKSTTAINLSYLSSASGAQTLLWDLDAQAASTFAFRVRPRVEGFGRKSLERVDTFLESVKGTDYDNLDLLPADFAYRKLDRFLERLSRPDRGLEEILSELGKGYDTVLLDCPPGFSLLTENILQAADLVLVPTIPTVLSLRTLARLVQYVGRRATAVRLRAFLSMVDRRKSLHRRVAAWTTRHPAFFLQTEIPFASIVEQVSVRRMPLSIVAPQDHATAAFESLWSDLKAALSEHPAPAASHIRRCAAFVDAIDELITPADGDTEQPRAPGDAPQGREVAETRGKEQSGQAHRFRIAVASEDSLLAIQRTIAPTASARSTLQLSHFFDTEGGVLARGGYHVQLLEEAERFAVVAGPVQEPDETEPTDRVTSVQIDGRWAAEILACRRSPLAVFEQRLTRPLPAPVAAVLAVAGDRRIRRVSWRGRRRRSLGQVAVSHQGETVAMNIDLDAVTLPSREVAYEIRVSILTTDRQKGERALEALLSRAGVTGQVMPVPPWTIGTTLIERSR